MGRNKNRNNRSANRRSGAALQAGGRPQAAGSSNGGGKRDAGLPAFFKQRHAIEAEKRLKAAGNVLESVPGVMSMDDHANHALLAKMQGLADSSPEHRHPTRSAIDKSASFEKQEAARDLALTGKRDSSAKAFMRDVKGVIDNSDVILQILDARDPMGSRSRQTELMAMGSGKKVVLVMNKIDLIPTTSLQAWLRYLRNDFPTLAFKSSTQKQRSNLKQGQGEVSLPKSGSMSGADHLSHGSEAVGAASLLQLLKNYARTAKNSKLKQQLTVGVVGPPNVGKSSLINSLLRTRACAVASTPGWTKVVQGVMLEKGIRLLDCPGVVLGGNLAHPDEEATTNKGRAYDDEAAWSVLRNTVKVELIEDPVAPIQAMLRRVEAKQLEELYNIDGGFNAEDAHDFLLRVSLLRGKLGKGGVPDLEGAARIVLHDWNIGKISFHTMPPSVHPSLAALERSVAGTKEASQEATELPEATSNLIAGASLVSNFSEAFDLQALFGEADAEALGTEPRDNPRSGTGETNGKPLVSARERRFIQEVPKGEEAEEIDEDEEQPNDESHLTLSSLGKRRRGMQDIALSDDDSSEGEEGLANELLSDGEDDKDSRADANEDGAFTLQHSSNSQRSSQAEQQTRRQRELLTTFSSEEMAGMARRRSDIRKASKRNKKRLRKSGAGLVDALESSLAFSDQPSEAEVSHPNREEGNKLKSKMRSERRGLFDVLDQGVNATEEHEEEL